MPKEDIEAKRALRPPRRTDDAAEAVDGGSRRNREARTTAIPDSTEPPRRRPRTHPPSDRDGDVPRAVLRPSASSKSDDDDDWEKRSVLMDGDDGGTRRSRPRGGGGGPSSGNSTDGDARRRHSRGNASATEPTTRRRTTTTTAVSDEDRMAAKVPGRRRVLSGPQRPDADRDVPRPEPPVRGGGGPRRRRDKTDGRHDNAHVKKGEGIPSEGGKEGEEEAGFMKKDESSKSFETADRDVFRPPTFFRYAVPLGSSHRSVSQPAAVLDEETTERVDPKSSSPSPDDVDVVVPVATLVHSHSAKVRAEEVPDDPPWYRRRVFWIVVIVQVTVIALVVGLVIGLRDDDDDGSLRLPDAPVPAMPTAAPTPSPTSMPTSTIDLEEFFGDVPTPFRTSFDVTLAWFGNTTGVPVQSRGLQRFVLSWLYHHTTDNGQSPWIACNPPDGNTTIFNDTDACVFFSVLEVSFFTSGGTDLCLAYNPETDARWLSEADECGWAGITCNDEGDVTEMNLPAVGIRGPFPYFLSVLPLLTKLDLSIGGITGELPSELGEFESLTEVNLERNQIHGTLPTSLFSSKVSFLDLSSNRLNMTLPAGVEFSSSTLRLKDNSIPGPLPDISEAGNLDLLDLSDQNGAMAGTTIPPSWGSLTQLRSLDLRNNGMQGEIPAEFENLIQMQVFYVSSNNFHGSLPSMPWPNLRQLLVQSNAFNGTFPESLYGNGRVTEIDLSFNRFRGSLSDDFQGMDSLRRLDLSTNAFTGFLPLSIGDLSRASLRNLFLQFNEFEGDVPAEYCELTLTADCLPQRDPRGIPPFGPTLPPLTEAAPANPCPALECCERCCDRETGQCIDYIPSIGESTEDPCEGYFEWDPETGEISGFFLYLVEDVF